MITKKFTVIDRQESARGNVRRGLIILSPVAEAPKEGASHLNIHPTQGEIQLAGLETDEISAYKLGATVTVTVALDAE